MEYCELGLGGEIHVRIAMRTWITMCPRHSQADQYAAYNVTSSYTGIVTYPMLTDRLSKGISSLMPGQDCQAGGHLEHGNALWQRPALEPLPGNRCQEGQTHL
ncbi:MAG: RNB domain-containing ribonuclease [Methanomicrobiales archaeon]